MVTNDLFTPLSSIWITSAFTVGADICDVTAIPRIGHNLGRARTVHPNLALAVRLKTL